MTAVAKVSRHMDDWGKRCFLSLEREAELVVKGAAWTGSGIIESAVQDDWDASSSEEEAGKTVAGSSSSQPIVTKRELKRQQVMKESEDVFGSEMAPRDDEVDRERQVRMADLQSGMNLLRIDASEDAKAKIVEGSITKKASAGHGSTSLIAGRPFSTQKDLEEIVKVVVREIQSYEAPSAGQKVPTKPLYPLLLEALFKELVGTREPPEIRRLASALEDIASIKLRKLTTAKAKPQIQLGGKKLGGGASKYDIDGSLGAGDDFFDD